MSTVLPVECKPAVVVSPEVYEYASKHGIEEPLQRLLEATPRIYPTASSIKVVMRQDVEDKEMWFIIFEVRMPAEDVSDHLAADRRWGEEWARAYPYPRNHSFVLRLEPVER